MYNRDKITFIWGDIVELINLIPTIPVDQKYWFIRTNAGEYYDDFVNEGFVGIGWNKVQLSHLDISVPLGDIVKEKYPDATKANYVANQIKIFSQEIKKGDIVMVPSTKSKYIHFGVIDDDAAFEEDLPIELEDIENHPELEFNYEGACPYRKRRKVNWISVKRREKLDPQLYRLIYSQGTISNAKDYSEFIDRTLFDFYIKGEKCHMILHVEKQGNIKGNKLVQFMGDILDIAEENNDTEEEVDLKVSVQSPGTIEIIGLVPVIILAAVGIVGILGGRTKFLGMEIDSPGIMGRILEWRAQNKETKKQEEEQKDLTKVPEQQQQRLVANAENLDIRIPETLEKTLKQYIEQLNKENTEAEETKKEEK